MIYDNTKKTKKNVYVHTHMKMIIFKNDPHKLKILYTHTHTHTNKTTEKNK